MLNLVLPSDIRQKMVQALRQAGDREIGGVLMGAHIAPNHFEVREISIHKRGAVASFLRRIEEALGRINAFFRETGYQYTRYNYIGEWHSHPLFSHEPSATDDHSMHQIINDPQVGANFVVLLIVKLSEAGDLSASLHTYLPGGIKQRSSLSVD